MFTMNEQRRAKLKTLIDEVPPGFVIDTAWLERRGIARNSIHQYERNGWLERVGRALYRRPFAERNSDEAALDWRPYILSLQSIMHYDVHLGGTSALALFGHVHYLPMTDRGTLHLYGEKFPAWLNRLPINTRIVTHKRHPLFGESNLGIEKRDETSDQGITQSVGAMRWPVVASCPERAILEAINELPTHESFDNVDKLFEGLLTLRPRRMTELLGVCRSVKVKRLFMVFADRHNPPWRKHLNLDGVDFGSGPRALVAGGKLHPFYNIYVPKEFAGTSEMDIDHDG